MSKLGKVVWMALAGALISCAQTASPAGTPARIVVTVGHFYGHEQPTLTRDDLIVTQQYEPLPLTSLVALNGDRADLELYVLVDNSSSFNSGPTLEELRRFVLLQPRTTAVGVGYIEGGNVQVIENPTRDHQRAVKTLSAPAGSKLSNPFDALAELIRGLPPGSSRRAVLMISNGIDPAAADEVKDPSVEAAIDAAQRASVTVYAIYHPRPDYLTNDYSKTYSGQVQLAHLAYETGGEGYFLSLGPLPSFAPFLADIADHLANQYLLEFLANPSADGGALVPVTVKSSIPNVELMAPDKVWVPGTDDGAQGDRP